MNRLSKPVLPSQELANTLQQQHRQAVLNELSRTNIGEFDWENTPDDVMEAALTQAAALAGEIGHEIDWSIVEYDGGWPTPNFSVVKPIHTVMILGFNAISFNTQTTTWQTMVETQRNPDFLYKTDPDLEIRELSINLHEKWQPQSSVTIYRRPRATIIIGPDIPPLAIHQDDIIYSSIKHGIDLLDPMRVMSKVSADFGREAIDYLSDDVIRSLTNALKASAFEISNRRYS